MAFFIPWTAIGCGIGLIGWGIHQIHTKNDSADAAAKALLKNVPTQFQKWISEVSSREDGCNLKLKDDTPQDVRGDFKDYCARMNKK